MAVFSTASAALECAVQMQRDVDIDNRASVRPLGLRVGLSGGEVIREGTDYFGDPVVEAARLCSSASSGKILASQVVKAVAGRRAGYPYRALGFVELKGLPEPLDATFEVGWDPTPGHYPRCRGRPLTAQLSQRNAILEPAVPPCGDDFNKSNPFVNRGGEEHV